MSLSLTNVILYDTLDHQGSQMSYTVKKLANAKVNPVNLRCHNSP